MASYKKFQRNNSKYKDTANMNEKATPITKREEMSANQRHQLKLWVTFYRRNIHRFIVHYLGVPLRLYQILWVYLMSISSMFMAIAARSSAKSYLIGIYIVAECILRPGTSVVITSGSKDQAGLIITKKIDKEFIKNCPNIAREIKKIMSSGDTYEVQFWNGSSIIVKAANEKARGERTQINIYEEFRIVDKDIIDGVFTPMIIHRQPPFLSLPPYCDNREMYLEDGKEIYISSAWFKTEWIWNEFIRTVNLHYSGRNDVNFIAFDYKLVLKEGFKKQKQLDTDKSKMDDITWEMEYLNIMHGENEKAFFKFDMLNKRRKIKRAFYPLKSSETKNEHVIKRVDGEVRFLSMDVAVEAGKSNDNSIIACWRLLPTANGYQREVVYMESFNGVNSLVQALRLKQLYYDFNGDYVVIDYKSVGKGVYDPLTSITTDEDRDKEYPAWTVMSHSDISTSTYESMKERTLAINALPIVFPIVGTADLNHDIANALRDNLQKGNISFLVDELKGEDYLNKKFKKSKKIDLLEDTYLKSWYLHPYSQITAFINETVGLECKIASGKIKLETTNRLARKDRYSAIAYGNYFATLKDKEILKEGKKTNDWSDYVIFTKRTFK